MENVEMESEKLQLLPVEDQDIKPGQIFYHYKNLKPYMVLDSCKIQEQGVWVEAILYMNTIYKAENQYHFEKFVRTTQEFKVKFKKLGGVK